MSPDEAALVPLWREKRGAAEPEDVLGNLAVQLGAWPRERGYADVPGDVQPSPGNAPLLVGVRRRWRRTADRREHIRKSACVVIVHCVVARKDMAVRGERMVAVNDTALRERFATNAGPWNPSFPKSSCRPSIFGAVRRPGARPKIRFAKQSPH